MSLTFLSLGKLFRLKYNKPVLPKKIYYLLFFCLGVSVFSKPAFAQTVVTDPSTSAINQVLPGLNAAQQAGATPIIRIGVQDDAGGMERPETLVKFLQTLNGKISFPVYVVAGPNEPETELWASPGCSDGQSACIGPKVTAYMNSVIDGAGDLNNIKLLSPVFNLCSPVFPSLIASMGGANWGGLDAIAVNVYNGTPVGGSEGTINSCLSSRLPLLSSNLPVIITETGAFNGDKAAFKQEINALVSNNRVMGALLFNGFNTNPDWIKFEFSDAELTSLCDGNDCGSKKIGVNFATPYTNGDYARAGQFKMRFTLEILSRGGAKKRRNTPDNTKPEISYNSTLGGKGNGLSSPAGYVSWYLAASTSQNELASRQYPVGMGAVTNIEDYSQSYVPGSPTQLGKGYIKNEACLLEPNRNIHITINALSPDTTLEALQTIETKVQGFTAPYRDVAKNFIAGGISAETNVPNNMDESNRRAFDYKNGISTGTLSEQNNGEKQLKSWLCRLGASFKSVPLTAAGPGQTLPVSDIDFSYSPDGNKTSFEICNSMLPNGDCDWSKGDIKPLRASSLYCAMNMASSCGGEQKVDCGSVSQIPSSGEFFDVFKRRVTKYIALNDNTGSKAFVQYHFEINDPNPNVPKKSCLELANTDYGKGFGLDELVKSEQLSRFITSTDWGGLNYDDRHTILTLVPSRSGVFFINKPGSCRMALVTPIVVTNLTQAKGASDIAMTVMSQSQKDLIKKPTSCINYKNLSFDALAETDKLAALGVINQPDPKENTVRVSIQNKNPSGSILAGLNVILTFPNRIANCALESIFKTPIDPETGVKGDPFQHFFNLCRQDYDIPIDTTVFASADTVLYPKQIQTYSQNLMPQSAISKFNKSNPTTYDAVDIGIQLGGSNPPCPSKDDFGEQDFAGNKGAKCVEVSITDQGKLPSTSLFIAPSVNGLVQEQGKWLIPEKEQSQ